MTDVYTISSPKKQRDSNLELYRIITMLLIIAHHYVVNSGLTATDGPIYAHLMSFPSLFLLVFGAWGKIGINCFVLITGYFMCRSQISAKKFFRLLLELMFYRIVIGSIFWISGYEVFSLRAFVKVLLPFTTISHNFSGTYLVFFLFIPFLNILVHHMNEKQHIRLLLLTCFTYVFFETAPFFSVTMNYVSWYMVLYLIASYIRLYHKPLFEKTALWGVATLVCVLLSAASVLICARFGIDVYRFVTDSNTFLAVATGVCSFLFFKNLKIKNSRLINAVSSTCFGVLLIHANGDVMRRWLWKDLLDNVGMYDAPLMPLHAVGSVLAVFAVCAAIDYIRIRLIEAPFFRLFDQYWEKIAAGFARLEDKICHKLNIQP